MSRNLRNSLVLALALLTASAATAFAQAPPPSGPHTLQGLPRSGDLTWGGWAFHWDVGAHAEGLELSNVRFEGMSVLYKASLPVVRVKYRGEGESIGDGCGPYADRLHWDIDGSFNGIKKRPETATKVVARTFDDGTLELAVYAEIGGYDLWQGWYFQKSGHLEAKLYSTGWSCGTPLHNPQVPEGHQRDHEHHPYWRFDFDVDGSNNEIWEVRTKASGDVNMTKRVAEGNAARNPDDTEVAWVIRRPNSARHVLVRQNSKNLADEPLQLPDAPGSPWFAFSSMDAAWRRYHSEEDVGWCDFDDDHTRDLGYLNGESTDGTDLVLWIANHMPHEWSQWDEEHSQWHGTELSVTIDVRDILPIAEADPSRPAVAMAGSARVLNSQRLDVFEHERGNTGGFRWMSSKDQGNTWAMEDACGVIGAGAFVSGPAAVVSADSKKLHAFGLGMDSHIWRAFSADGGTNWAVTWAPIGEGVFKSGPAAVMSANGKQVHVFSLGMDNRIWRAFSPDGGANWTVAWAPIGEGVFKSGPAAAISADGQQLHVFGLGLDDHIWRAFSPDGGANWTVAWTPIGEGVFKSGPAATVSANGQQLHVFAVGSDDRIWRAFSPDGATTWTLAWAPIGDGVFSSGPAASVSADGKKLNVFGRGKEPPPPPPGNFPSDPDEPRIWRAFSPDGGATWSVAWAPIKPKMCPQPPPQ